MLKLTVGFASGIAATALAVASVNYVNLQRPLSQVLQEDSRNKGIEVFAHYKYFVVPGVLVYDLRAVQGTSSPIDVTRVLLQFAQRQQDRQFKSVELSYRGQDKFVLQGEYFRQLGHEYGKQNAAYTLRTLPEHVYRPDGKRAFGQWSGGLLGVLARQMEDFGSWHRAWYIDELAAASGEGGNHAR